MSKKPTGQHSQTNRHAKSGQYDVVKPGRHARSRSAWTTKDAAAKNPSRNESGRSYVHGEKNRGIHDKNGGSASGREGSSGASGRHGAREAGARASNSEARVLTAIEQVEERLLNAIYISGSYYRRSAISSSIIAAASSEPELATDWARVDAMRDAEIDAQIAADPDAAPALDAGWLARAERVQPERIKKEAISLRVDADVLAWFKAQGVGYQSRMNSVLRAYAEHAAGGSERLNLLASALRTADDEE